MIEILDLVMVGALCAAILAGYPVVFTLGGIAILFALLGMALDIFNLALLGALSTRVFAIVTNEALIAIPLFVLMGLLLERSRIAEELLEEMGRLFGALRGGLAVSVVLVGALLAASTGIVGATVTTMGLIALPTMLRLGYDKRLAAGTVCTAGTLGQIVPPSTLLIILADVMSSGYQQAQYEQGKFTVETVSVGQVFAAALVPGLLLTTLYLAYVLLLAWLRPADAPALPDAAGQKVAWGRVGKVLVPPIALIVAVLGSILGGIATPTEAAAVGAMGALVLSGLKLAEGRSNLPIWAALAATAAMLALARFLDLRLGRSDPPLADQAGIAVAALLCLVLAWGIAVCLARTLRADVMRPVLTGTLTVTSMIFAMLIGASLFALVFRGLGGDVRVEEFLAEMPGGAFSAFLFVMVLIFVMGFFLDFVEISVIVLPIVVPILLLMGMDPLWLAVMIAINLQTSFLTPPFGFSLFYLRGAAPKEIRTLDIYRGVLPFIALQAVGIALVYALPGLGTWLPNALF